jgi:hypothetical protein
MRNVMEMIWLFNIQNWSASLLWIFGSVVCKLQKFWRSIIQMPRADAITAQHTHIFNSYSVRQIGNFFSNELLELCCYHRVLFLCHSPVPQGFEKFTRWGGEHHLLPFFRPKSAWKTHFSVTSAPCNLKGFVIYSNCNSILIVDIWNEFLKEKAIIVVQILSHQSKYSWRKLLFRRCHLCSLGVNELMSLSTAYYNSHDTSEINLLLAQGAIKVLRLVN